MLRWRVAVSAFLLGCLSMTAGCAGSDRATLTATGAGAAPPAPATAPSAPASTGPAGVGGAGPVGGGPDRSKFLTVRAKTLDGRDFDAATLAGRPVVVWFWAPWCHVCNVLGPMVNEAAVEYRDKVSFVGVGGLDPSTGEMKKFVSETGTDGFVHLADSSGGLYRQFEVTAQNTYLILRADGTVAEKRVLHPEDMVAEVKKIVG